MHKCMRVEHIHRTRVIVRVHIHVCMYIRCTYMYIHMREATHADPSIRAPSKQSICISRYMCWQHIRCMCTSNCLHIPTYQHIQLTSHVYMYR